MYKKEIEEVKVQLQKQKKAAQTVIEGLKKENEELKHQKLKMKEEWAEVYASMQTDIDSFKADIQLLNTENDKLLKLTEKSASQSRKSEVRFCY